MLGVRVHVSVNGAWAWAWVCVNYFGLELTMYVRTGLLSVCAGANIQVPSNCDIRVWTEADIVRSG